MLSCSNGMKPDFSPSKPCSPGPATENNITLTMSKKKKISVDNGDATENHHFPPLKIIVDNLFTF